MSGVKKQDVINKKMAECQKGQLKKTETKAEKDHTKEGGREHEISIQYD